MDNGSGFFSIGYHSSFMDRICRPSANGAGSKQPEKKPVTNEEWFNSLSTKEKAKVFYDFRKGGRISWRINEILMDIHDVIMDGYEDITPLKAIEIWLKEEHRDEA